MNLAEIRKKAQQQEVAPASWEETPAALSVDCAAAAAETVVEIVPLVEHLRAAEVAEAVEETFPELLECALGEDLLDAEEGYDDDAEWSAPTPPVAEVEELPLAAAASVAQAAPAVAPRSASQAPARVEPAPRHAAPRPFDPLSAILKGREEASARDVAGVATDEESAVTVELLCFKVAQEEYAISIMDVKEIIKPRELTEVPRTPPFVGGVLSLRGIIIPVFDLRVRLGLSTGEGSPKERIVVVKRERGFCGVLVDQVVQVVRLPLSGFEPPPVVLEGIDRDFVQGIGRVDGRILILLDMEKVLDVTLS